MRIDWEIRPLKGVGPLDFGTPREDIPKVLRPLNLEVERRKKGTKNIDTTVGGAVHLHYGDDDRRLMAIECWADEALSAQLNGCDVLREPAATVVQLLDVLAPLDRSGPVGSQCLFPSLSLGLWRPSTPNTDEQSRPTFESVLVGCKGYYDGV